MADEKHESTEDVEVRGHGFTMGAAPSEDQAEGDTAGHGWRWPVAEPESDETGGHAFSRGMVEPESNEVEGHGGRFTIAADDEAGNSDGERGARRI